MARDHISQLLVASWLSGFSYYILYKEEPTKTL